MLVNERCERSPVMGLAASGSMRRSLPSFICRSHQPAPDDARVVDQHRNRAVLAEHGARQLIAGGAVGDVGRVGPGAADRLGRGARRLGVYVDGNDARAGFGHSTRDACADARSRAGDQRQFPFERPAILPPFAFRGTITRGPARNSWQPLPVREAAA